MSKKYTVVWLNKDGKNGQIPYEFPVDLVIDRDYIKIRDNEKRILLVVPLEDKEFVALNVEEINE